MCAIVITFNASENKNSVCCLINEAININDFCKGLLCVCVYEVHIYVECQEREQFEEAKID